MTLLRAMRLSLALMLSDRPPQATTWLQPTTTRRTRRSLGNRLCRDIGHRAAQDDLPQRSRLQALHRLQLELHATRSRPKSAS